MSLTDGDPTAVRSIAVSAGDVVAAVEARRTTDREVVLRITPPFAGRMRARLHDADASSAAETGAVHVDPTQLLAPSAPAYPRPADTEDELRADPDSAYDLDAHRRRHAAAVHAWRECVAEAVRESVTLATPRGNVEVRVRVLG